MRQRFKDRRDAGRALAARLGHLADDDTALVLALPRGGVPVGFEVAESLGVPLDVLIVRKLGVPGHEELAMGAIASGNIRIVNETVTSEVDVSERAFAAAAAQEEVELERRERLYRGTDMPLDVQGRTAILVDDGLATGATMRAAIAASQRRGAGRVVVGVPAASPSTVAALAREVDEIVSVITPEPFQAVGVWYEDFSQTQDDEVRELLARVRPDSTDRRTRGDN